MKAAVAPHRLHVGVVAVSIAVLTAITVILLDRARPTPPRLSPKFGARDVEAAELKVLPFRRSGLIFHWADDSPAVYVRRSMWEELPDETKRDLGQSIAVAKNQERITIFDETLEARLVVCTANGRCTPVRN